MFKNKIFIIIVVIAIIASAAGWYAYDRHQSALAAEKARQEELAKAEAEKKAAEEEAAKKAEEEAAKKAAKEEAFKVDEQGRGPLEQELKGDNVVTKEADELSADALAQIEEQQKKFEPEFEAIKAMLTDYNKAQNEYDYRTFTGHEGEEYMTPEMAEEYAAEVAPILKKNITQKKIVSKFDGITIRILVFTTEDFSKIVSNPDNPTHAYAEMELRSHNIEPAEQKVTRSIWAVWLKKIDGQWKVYAEERLDSSTTPQ
jgi:small-conductance mechanosensitive channel